MSLFSSALTASAAAASGQHYPEGALYLVATPIGNLADISLRALHCLGLVDTIACEDTRHTQTLLRAYGIEKAGHQLLALHQHNEESAAQQVLERLRAGQRVAYVSDAGTPCISDPGARLVAVARGQGVRCIPLPGASSVTTLLSAAGCVSNHADAGGFVFHGFLPSKATERTRAVQLLQKEERTVLILEAPHRISALAQALSELGVRLVTIGRELTKQFEEITTLPAHELPAWLAADANRLRGEFALVLHPQAAASDTQQDAETLRILHVLLAELPLKTAVKLATEITGTSKNTLYDLALAWKEKQKGE